MFHAVMWLSGLLLPPTICECRPHPRYSAGDSEKYSGWCPPQPTLLPEEEGIRGVHLLMKREGHMLSRESDNLWGVGAQKRGQGKARSGPW